MVKFLTFFSCLFFLANTNAQVWLNVTNQYIHNPSFEEYSSCPKDFSQPSQYWIDSCKYWYTPTFATPDYYNKCSTDSLSGIPLVGVPVNWFGYQIPYSGNAFCGFYGFSSFGDHWCEYIQTKLKTNLLIGKEYSFSMRVVMANQSNAWGLSLIGANFTDSSKIRPTFYNSYNTTPTVLNKNGPITDTLNWQLVQGNFIANGTENYLTIGWWGDEWGEWGLDSTVVPETYFLVDSLILKEKINLPPEVIDCKAQLKLIEEFNILTPNGDGKNDCIDFAMYNLQAISFEVYNRWGNSIFKSNNINLVWCGANNNQQTLQSSTYFYILKYTDTCGDEHTVKSYLNINL